MELDVRGGEVSIDAAVGQAWDIFGTIDVLLYCCAVPGNLLICVIALYTVSHERQGCKCTLLRIYPSSGLKSFHVSVLEALST